MSYSKQPPFLSFLLGIGLLFLFRGPAVATEDETLPEVHILATGGTISGAAPERIMLSGYKAGSRTIEEIIATVPEIHDVAAITSEQVNNVGSGSITDIDLLKLYNRITQLIEERPTIDGFVVTHGTGTMEETAYFLHLTIRTDKPIVCVGAMRPLTAVGTDAPVNLYNAVRVAASQSARGKGAFICLNDEINCAREGTKTHTLRLETFRAGEFGLLGYADPDHVVFYREPTRRHTFASEFDLSGLEDLPDVDVIYGGYQETSAVPLKALLAEGVDGVIMASGSGNFEEAMETAKQMGVALVSSDRKGTGRVMARASYVDRGLVAADSLRPQKARMLLKVALTKTKDPRELQRIFNQY